MKLISSGAYLQSEFTSEVGLLPPSFLPIGNKRLYEYQVQFLNNCKTKGEDIYLSVPESYELDCFDTIRLNELGVQILLVPDGLSLGESILYSWNASAKHHSTFSLLHGDTLFLDGCFDGKNLISVHSDHGFYKRASLGMRAKAFEGVCDKWSNDSEQVVSGFFCFSNPLYFMKSLVELKSDFIQGIVRYHQEFPLTLVSDGRWLDFGHINSFYHSRTKMTTERDFNELSIGLHSVTKSSKIKPKKIYAEGSWFSNIPLPLRLYTPALLKLDKKGDEFLNANYSLEYLYLLPLSDLFVFSRLNKGSWKTIFDSISTMFMDFYRHSSDTTLLSEIDRANEIYLPKTLRRLNEFSEQSDFDCKESNLNLFGESSLSLVEIARISAKFISPAKIEDISIVHGDLCFSNMLFDSRAELIKCIDPRGISQNGELSLYGDRRYDLAKIYHSAVGLYDLIIAGRYSLEVVDGCYNLSFSLHKEFCDNIAESFRRSILVSSGYEEKEILAITVHLFLSMLPLHEDRPDRQQAFIANALRLFKVLQKKE